MRTIILKNQRIVIGACKDPTLKGCWYAKNLDMEDSLFNYVCANSFEDLNKYIKIYWL